MGESKNRDRTVTILFPHYWGLGGFFWTGNICGRLRKVHNAHIHIRGAAAGAGMDGNGVGAGTKREGSRQRRREVIVGSAVKMGGGMAVEEDLDRPAVAQVTGKGQGWKAPARSRKTFGEARGRRWSRRCRHP